MMGYGPENDHFVVELTYNYGIKHYEKGNEFQVRIGICSSTIVVIAISSIIIDSN